MKKSLFSIMGALMLVGCSGAGSESGFFSGTITVSPDRSLVLLDCATMQMISIENDGSGYTRLKSSFDKAKEQGNDGSFYVQFYGTVKRVSLPEELSGEVIVSSVHIDKFGGLHRGMTCNPNSILSNRPFTCGTDTLFLRYNYTYLRWNGSRNNMQTGKWMKSAADEGMIFPDNGKNEKFDLIIGPDGASNGLVVRMNTDGRETNFYPM